MTSLKSALLGSVAALFASTAVAQDLPAPIAEATAGDPNVAIWKVGDEDTNVYLMGTIHILNRGIDWSSDDFESAWAESSTVFLEADVVSPEAAQAAGPVLMSKGFYTDGQTLAGQFTDEEIEIVNEGLAQFGLSVEGLGNVRPWLASIQLAQLALAKVGGDPMAGVEMILAGRAAEDGKDMRYFETVSQQLEIISGIPDEAWATSLVEGMGDLAELEVYFGRMVGLWYQGDADGLGEFMTEAWAETPEIATALLDVRNEDWANQLDTLIKDEEGTFFVAVGAGHLAGENSVQDYMAARGYDTVRVNP